MTNNNIKNIKTKTATTMLTAILFVLALSSLTEIPFVGAQTNQQNTKIDPSSPTGAICLNDIHKDTQTKSAFFDEKKAIASALGYDQFRVLVKNDRVTNGHLVMIWSIDPVSCTVTPIGLTVQFTDTDSMGHQKVVIVSEDLKSLIPTGVMTKKVVEHTVSSTTSANLAGYQFNAPSGTQSPYVYESALTYYVPVPGVPTKPAGFTCGTSGASQCYASVWSGISVDSGGVGKLVQSGTDSVCSGTSGTACGTTSYRAWLEIYDGPGSSLNQISYCDQSPHNPTLTPKGNDEILAQTTNEARYGGNNYDYDVYVDDVTQNIQCSTTGWVYNVGNPNYGLYMVERPSFSGTLSKLAEFNPPSDTISNVYGTIWYNNLNNGIQVPYDAGSGLKYYMENGGVYNVSPSTVSSSRFTLTWNTSQNTG